jgi:hypothetical protein
MTFEEKINEIQCALTELKSLSLKSRFSLDSYNLGRCIGRALITSNINISKFKDGVSSVILDNENQEKNDTTTIY